MLTLAKGTGGSSLSRAVAALSYSGARRLQWPHLKGEEDEVYTLYKQAMEERGMYI